MSAENGSRLPHNLEGNVDWDQTIGQYPIRGRGRLVKYAAQASLKAHLFDERLAAGRGATTLSGPGNSGNGG